MNKKVTYFILISISIFYLVFSQKSICQVTSNYKYLNDSNLIVEYIDSASQLKYNKPDSSKQILEKALGIARKNSLQINEAEILNRIGGIYYILGKYDLSMDYFSQAFEVYSELKNKKGIAASYNNMGMIYGVHSHYQKTIYYHKKSIKICKEINDIKLLGTNYFNLGIIYNEKGENDSALIFANKAIEQYNKLNLPEENIRVYNLKGRIYAETGNFKLGKKMFDLVIKQEDTLKYLWDYSYAHDGMALLFYEQGKYKKSIEYGKKAISLAKKLNAPWDIQSAALILSKSYNELKQYDSAYNYLMLNKIYNDSIINKETRSHIEYVELKNSQIKNEQLIQEAERQKEKIAFKNKLMWVLSIGAVVLLLLLILFLYKNHQKQILSKKLRFINTEILKNNKDLERLNTTKDLIFRVIAHDLMGPIGNVISFTDLMNKEYSNLGKEKTKEIIQKLNITIIQTYNLLDNLLHWAKVQMNESTTSIITFSPKKSTNRIVNSFESALKEKNIHLEVNIDDKIKLNTDEVSFQIIIRNLLANAIKFTNINGVINVSAKEQENNIEFIVKDNGVGIDEEKLSLLFNSRPSISSLGTKGEKGSGIGLVLCNEFIYKLGGKIWAESKIGEGSSFYFTIPKQ